MKKGDVYEKEMAKRSNDNLYAVCSLSFVERRSYADGKKHNRGKGAYSD